MSSYSEPLDVLDATESSYYQIRYVCAIEIAWYKFAAECSY